MLVKNKIFVTSNRACANCYASELAMLMMMLIAIDATAGVDAHDAAGDDQDAC